MLHLNTLMLEINVTNVTAVVLTGLLVVFFGLILLIILMNLLGRFFAGKKPSAHADSAQSQPPKTQTVKKSPKIPSPEAAHAIVNDDETVAAIMGAVALMSAQDGVSYSVTSITPVTKTNVQNGGYSSNGYAPVIIKLQNRWAQAGLRDNTDPF